MALTQDVFNRYFEKSERRNMLQKRIRLLAKIIQSQCYVELNKRRPKERFEQFEEISLDGAILKMFFGYGTDSWCRLQLISEGRSYCELTEGLMPSEFVEPVYELLPQLVTLAGHIDLALPSKIEAEILGFLERD